MQLINENSVKIWPESLWKTWVMGWANQDFGSGAREAQTNTVFGVHGV